MKLRDAVAMLVFFAIYTPLSVLVWQTFKLPDLAMILIFLLGIFYVVLYLLFAILLTPPKKIQRIEPEIIEVKQIETETKPVRKRRTRKPKLEEENNKEDAKNETKKPRRRRRRVDTQKSSEEQKEVILPNAQEKEVKQEIPDELPSPFSDFGEENQDLD